jgi:hypothetical protein
MIAGTLAYEREIDALLASFDRAVANGTPELVLVSGYSGYRQVLDGARTAQGARPAPWPLRVRLICSTSGHPNMTLGQAFHGLVRPLLGRSEAELGWVSEPCCLIEIDRVISICHQE